MMAKLWEAGKKPLLEDVAGGGRSNLFSRAVQPAPAPNPAKKTP